MKKKAKRSNRNRHTGRINNYKQHIIESYQVLTVIAGREYFSIKSGVRSTEGHNLVTGAYGTLSVPIYSSVRAPK